MLPRARVGTFLVFALGGLLCGAWTARMPAMAAEFGLGPRDVGIALLAWGAAAAIAMQLLRPIIARAGSRTVLRAAAPLAAVASGLVAVAPGYGLLLIAVTLFGMAFGVMDVSMNAQASVVEQAYGRPLMSSMHAGWCVGAMSGGLFGSLTAHLGFSFTGSVLTSALLVLPATLLIGRMYLADPPTAMARNGQARPRLPMVVYFIGALTFLAFMGEGAIADWSGLLLHDELRASEAVAALGYPLFQFAMLCGRLVGDRLNVLLGARRLLVLGGLGTTLAWGIVLLAPSTPVALAGFLLIGAAICTAVPTLVSLSGTAAPGRSAASIAQVGTIGYSGLLLGPIVIGLIADHTSLRLGLVTVVASTLMIAAGASFLPATFLPATFLPATFPPATAPADATEPGPEAGEGTGTVIGTGTAADSASELATA